MYFSDISWKSQFMDDSVKFVITNWSSLGVCNEQHFLKSQLHYFWHICKVIWIAADRAQQLSWIILDIHQSLEMKSYLTRADWAGMVHVKLVSQFLSQGRVGPVLQTCAPKHCSEHWRDAAVLCVRTGAFSFVVFLFWLPGSPVF